VIGLVAFAAQLAIVAHAPDTAGVCQAIEVSVAISAPGNNAPQVIAPSLAPFDILRSSAVPHVTYDPRGRGSIIAEYKYVLTTDQVGTFRLGSFEARLGSTTARSRPIEVAVRSTGRSK
jgi:hypothetical protein